MWRWFVPELDMYGTTVHLLCMLSLFKKPSAAPVFDFFASLREGEAQLEKAAEFAAVYAENQPFPHILIPQFFDEGYLRRVSAEIPSPLTHQGLFNADVKHLQENKFAWRDVGKLGARSHEFLGFLASKPFLEFLSIVTGIKGLMPDPYLWGAGFHQILRGGKLAVHADFNIHPVSQLYRRVNLLLYLNEGWDDAWGGNLELWNHDMTECAKKISPKFNNMVIFSTTEDSFHGHPDPLDCPPDVVRRSLALYYYTHEYISENIHSTLWRDRPQDAGKVADAMNQFQKN